MGSIQFLIPPQHQLNADAVDCAYMVGTDGVPWESHVEIIENRLIVTRDTGESGRLVILWHVDGHGFLALSTSTLAPADRPYRLPLELARGSLARLQSQLNTAEVRGFKFNDDARQLLQKAMTHFVNASLAQSDLERSSVEANQSLAHSLTLTTLMGQNERVTSQADGQEGATSVWGAVLHDSQEAAALAKLDRTIPNVVMINQSWCDLEVNPGEWDWSGLDEMIGQIDIERYRVGYGPLLEIDRSRLPDWLYLWEDDVDAIQSYVMAYVRKIVGRYAGKFRFWLCTAGTNMGGALGLSEEQRLRLTVNALENVRQSDPRTPVLVSIKQPWGEYLGRTAQDLTPLQFADILVRGDLGLSALGLQIQLDCRSGHTLPRDLLEFNRMIDSWSQLGLPLVILLSVRSNHQGELPAGQGWELVTRVLELFAKKSAIHGVVWDPLFDDVDNAGGLVTASGEVRPIFDALERIAAGRTT